MQPHVTPRELLRWGLLLTFPVIPLWGLYLCLPPQSAVGATVGVVSWFSCLFMPVGLILLLVAAAEVLQRSRGMRPAWPNCENCGYLLLRLSEARCPECGSPFERPRQ